jgi:putative pre-16S rRNA nuclease
MQDNAPANHSRILAIDYGLKRIGIALSDPLKTFAYPFTTLQNDNKLWNELGKIIKEKEISIIILGYPLDDNGVKSSLTVTIEKFQKEILKKFRLEVLFWDERYTSVIAQEKILESVTKKSRRRNKGLIDQNSAAIILQEYLNTLN